MGKLHAIFLVDDRDWEYVGTSKEAVAQSVVALHAKLERGPDCITHKPCDIMGILVFDVHRESPKDFLEEVKKAGIPFDSAYFYGDDSDRASIERIDA